jgi:hypothetical protein
MNQWQTKSRREPVQLAVRVLVDAQAMAKFWSYVDIAKGEVSCLGIVEEINDANLGSITALVVTDFFLVKQRCSVDETTMDPAAVADLMLDLESKGIDSRKLRCWAHSHGSMNVFWSGTDDECINGLANGEYLLSLVVNKKRDAMCRLDQYHPAHMYLTDIVWEVRYPMIDGLAEQCLQEFKAKVMEDHGTNGYRRLGRGTEDHVQDLRAANERGALTNDELLEEMEWYYPEELREERPF